jgi:hypothetical protein
MVIMGHERERGQPEGRSTGGEGERALRREEDRNTLHVSVQRQHNKIHQTLQKSRAGWKYNGGGECMHSTLYRQVLVAHIYNPIYSESRDQEDLGGLKPAQANGL